MKKVLILSVLLVAVAATACVKEKSCRCAVTTEGRSQLVRIINIKHGSCEKLNYAGFYDGLDTLHIDNMLCTDFKFDADTLIVEQ